MAESEHLNGNETGNDHAGMSTSNTTTTTSSGPGTGSLPGQEAEAGPSRPRRSQSPPGVANTAAAGPIGDGHDIQRSASPSNVLPGPPIEQDGSSTAKAKDSLQDQSDPASTSTSDTGTGTGTGTPSPSPGKPYLDLATYPTQTLLRMLASLLQQIASANDQLRPEISEDHEHDEDGMDDQGSTSSGTRSRADSRASTQPGGTSTPTPTPAPAQVQALSNPNLNPAHPSPTTALFSDSASTPATGIGPASAFASATELEKAHPPSSTTPPALSNLSRPDASTQVHSPTTGRAETLFSASKTSLYHRSSLLSFHARHIPSISIEAYLLRILKYCPTTNEVFLGLLVYFDRMSRLGTPSGLGGAMKSGKGFAIDSYNVHRLVIAGVTVASKFFSDVFYTNSRYAKVGGLPPHELNQLELQFLLLNDFRLVIPYDEMQRYGNRLLGYWENKEADDREKELKSKGAGVGVPSEEEIKAASALANANGITSTPGSKANDGTDPTARSEQGQTQSVNDTDTTISAPAPAQTHTPTPVPSHSARDRPFLPDPSRETSFDAAAPAVGQGPPTNAITIA